ncbi:uncharacterized protein [Clytia hemisphaerica]|uniref:Uncharacterized protein n=1 Tax=Clytia hemisphaerica TaxID=252671 RepID=A0A7M5TPZ4_9CNID|eukprot:TCONS_00046713-protein
MSDLEAMIQSLKPLAINPDNCTVDLSLYEQINQNSNEFQDRQAKQFNLGNGLNFGNPISAAEYLLKREYGETFLFGEDSSKAIFIPPEFISSQYLKSGDSSVTGMLDYNVKTTLATTKENLLKNLPDFWFTKEFDAFMRNNQQQNQQSTSTGNSHSHNIDQTAFDKWRLNAKIMHLVIEFLGTSNLNLPATTVGKDSFIQGCLLELNTLPPCPKRPNNKQNLVKILQGKNGNTKKNIIKLYNENPPTNKMAKAVLEMELSDIGEQSEHSLFEQLSSKAATKILENAVVLSSVNFLTDLNNKRHQEFDFVIIFWQRKLIIGVEIKRQLTAKTAAFKQLNKYHKQFEERLGDQLVDGWTFFPTIYVQNDNGLSETQHFINTNTDIPAWLSNIISGFPIAPCQTPFIHPLEQLKKVLQLIVFTIHVSKKNLATPIISSNWVDYVQNVMDSLYTVDNVIFYSMQQLPILFSEDTKYKKLLIKGGWGTGKSFLMMEKAKLLSKDATYKGKVLYVIWWQRSIRGPTSFKPLLYYQLKSELPPDIHVIAVDNFEPENIDFEEYKAVFVDEWEVARLRDDGFKILNLGTNLRNSKEIVNMSKVTYEKKPVTTLSDVIADPPQIFPKGPSPTYVNKINDAIILERKKSNLEGLLIIISSFDKNRDIDPKSNGEVKYFDEFSGKENPYEFLSDKGKGNILVLNEENDVLVVIDGFEWTTIIIDSHLVSDNNLSMRCTTTLYIVGDKNEDENDYDEIDGFPKHEFVKLLEITGDEEYDGLLYYFKEYIRNFFILRELTNEIKTFLPLLIECIQSINNISTKDATEHEKAYCLLKLSEFIISLYYIYFSNEDKNTFKKDDPKILAFLERDLSSQDHMDLKLEDCREYIMKLKPFKPLFEEEFDGLLSEMENILNS